MQLIPKELYSEEFNYYTDIPIDEFKAQLKMFLTKTWGLNFSVNLTGNFIEDNRFRITAKWEIGASPSLFLKSTRIVGNIIQNTDNRTRINLTVSPHSAFIPLFFMVYAFMIFLLVEIIQKNIEFKIWIIPALILIISPKIITILSKFSKDRLKNRFVAYFNLMEY